MSDNGRSNYYIDPKEFHREMVEFKEANADLKEGERPDIPDNIARKIMQVCERHSRHRQFFWKPYRDEMVLDAIAKCVDKVMKYDHEKFNNPFNYFSQIAYYEFINRISKEENEKRQRAQFSRQETSRIYAQSMENAPEGSQDEHRMDAILEGMFHSMDEEAAEMEKNKQEAKKKASSKKRTTLYHQKRQKEKEEREKKA